ncbi:lipase chaperone protein [Marinobacter daqiaonensis]|uniref:Lipase chaperone n=1 Tax=Marinobacter daqiaonensis TaxID=650891 RepID=A0A1I6JC79_9GAMM|nr:lipase secretion chaperone [Marinobacter daqiaonensis]SFR76514.1 lipase chaperone protein [Marinobacter daqiaonensis]
MSTRVGKSRQPKTEPRGSSRTTLLGIGALALTGVAAAIWIGGRAMMPEPAPQASNEYETAQAQVQKEAEPAAESGEAPLFSESLLTADQTPETVETEPAEDVPSLDIPFGLEQIAIALSRVEIGEDGQVVINENAQTILEQAFLDAGPQMNEEQLAQLKTLIAAGLEGPAGEQAVDIAEKFFRYSNAFKEISDTLAVRADPASLKDDYEQVARLRRTHLGPELAEQLYGREEKLTRYTLEVMEIQADPNLTPEQREEKRQALASEYPHLLGPDEASKESGETPLPAQATN